LASCELSLEVEVADAAKNSISISDEKMKIDQGESSKVHSLKQEQVISHNLKNEIYFYIVQR
jgi:hypothetical protein